MSDFGTINKRLAILDLSVSQMMIRRTLIKIQYDPYLRGPIKLVQRAQGKAANDYFDRE